MPVLSVEAGELDAPVHLIFLNLTGLRLSSRTPLHDILTWKYQQHGYLSGCLFT